MLRWYLRRLLGCVLRRLHCGRCDLRHWTLLTCFCLNFRELKPIDDVFTQRCINAGCQIEIQQGFHMPHIRRAVLQTNSPKGQSAQRLTANAVIR